MQTTRRQGWLLAAAILLLMPALLINLGLMTFIDDEGIRALVALEMKLSGNYIVPTLHGEYYYNKPPLYNWLLLLWFSLTGKFTEFNARFPTVVALCAYAWTIFYFYKKYYSRELGLLTAFIFLTCGRILFWDSMLGLIDITFSWVMFLLFMVVYEQFKKKNFWQLFLLTYFLTAVGFMLKGLPALVFQATTLLVYFVYKKQFKKLISIQHTAGILLLAVLVGAYYLLYHQYNDLQNVFTTLFTESSKRTVVEFGWKETLVHLFTFPFEMLYHFLPWSILLIYFLRKQILQDLREQEFTIYLLLIFLANILVYWSSPEVYPRYLLMHAPLIFGVYLYLHKKHEQLHSWQFKFLQPLFGLVISLIALAAFTPLFIERTQFIPYVYLKTFAVAIPIASTAVLYWKWKAERLWVLIVFLLLFRIGFDLFILPARNDHDFGDKVRKSAIKIGQNYSDHHLYIYKDIEMHSACSFYLTRSRGKIIPRAYSNFDTESLYIIDPGAYPDLQYETLDTLYMRHGKDYYLLGRLAE